MRQRVRAAFQFAQPLLAHGQRSDRRDIRLQAGGRILRLARVLARLRRHVSVLLQMTIQAFFRFHHFGDVRKLLDQLVATEAALDGDGRFARPRTTIFTLQQLDLLLQKILR